jgi:hypothetical protein
MQAFTSQASGRLQQTPCTPSSSFTESLPIRRCRDHCSRHCRSSALPAAASSRSAQLGASQQAAPLQAPGRLQHAPCSGTSQCPWISANSSGTGVPGTCVQASRRSSALQAVGSSLAKAGPTALTAPDEKLYLPFKVRGWTLHHPHVC